MGQLSDSRFPDSESNQSLQSFYKKEIIIMDSLCFQKAFGYPSQEGNVLLLSLQISAFFSSQTACLNFLLCLQLQFPKLLPTPSSHLLWSFSKSWSILWDLVLLQTLLIPVMAFHLPHPHLQTCTPTPACPLLPLYRLFLVAPIFKK